MCDRLEIFKRATALQQEAEAKLGLARIQHKKNSEGLVCFATIFQASDYDFLDGGLLFHLVTEYPPPTGIKSYYAQKKEPIR